MPLQLLPGALFSFALVKVQLKSQLFNNSSLNPLFSSLRIQGQCPSLSGTSYKPRLPWIYLCSHWTFKVYNCLMSLLILCVYLLHKKGFNKCCLNEYWDKVLLIPFCMVTSLHSLRWHLPATCPCPFTRSPSSISMLMIHITHPQGEGELRSHESGVQVLVWNWGASAGLIIYSGSPRIKENISRD